jgi:hypothetical protein
VNPAIFATIPVLLVAGTAMGLIIVRNWRWMIILLFIQYIGVFWMLTSIWPVGLAAVKLIIGWMAAAVLGATRSTFEVGDSEFQSVSGRVFQAITASIVWALVFSIAAPMQYWIPAPLPILQGSLMLFGLGLLHLGMTTNPMRVVIGLLTVMAGFEVVHASIEASVLLAGLMGVVNLGLSLIGAYTLLSATLETAE